MSVEHQTELPLIARRVENRVIRQRAIDGYINATDMCNAVQPKRKFFAHYYERQSTKAFLAELEADIGIPISELVQRVRGGHPERQGTWVHPYVATDLATWCSPKFRVRVMKWVTDWFSGRTPDHYPDHLRRYTLNNHKIPLTHFSMLNQMILHLLAPLERHGYRLDDKMMPDISLGKIFSGWLRRNGHDPDSFPVYEHEFTDGRGPVDARLYPIQLMPEFIVQLGEWFGDGRARKYFLERDENAVVALDRVLAELPSPPKQLGSVGDG